MLYFFFYSSVISRLVGTQLIVVNGLLSELPAHTAQNGSEITISVYLSRGRAELKHTYIKKMKWLKKKKSFLFSTSYQSSWVHRCLQLITRDTKENNERMKGKTIKRAIPKLLTNLIFFIM